MKQLKVLINAYACSPGMGSEEGVGWNWCIHLAKYCELHIITEGEFRNEIEKALEDLPQKDNIFFYYNPVSNRIRSIAKNQGDWRFYYYYKKWQKRTLEIAKNIITEHPIDIMHQLNMIGFREPGYLFEIEGVPFVWGPIGGMKQFPIPFLKGEGLKMNLFFRLKNFLNLLQIRYSRRVDKAIKKSSQLISAIPDSYLAIKKYKHRESIHIPETGSFPSDIEFVSDGRFESEMLNVIWIGKFDFRKQLQLAINAIAATGNKKIQLNVYGGGSVAQVNKINKLIDSLGLNDQVSIKGSVPNYEVRKAMQHSDLFLFTSVNDDTSTVVLEAISNHLPVLCFDAFGFGAIVDDTVGKKVPLTTPKESIASFAKELNVLYDDRSLLKEYSKNCVSKKMEFSWKNKAIKVIDIYNSIL